MPTPLTPYHTASFAAPTEPYSKLLRAQHKLFTTLPDDVTPPELTRLAYLRTSAVEHRRLQGRTSAWPQLRAGTPLIGLAVTVSALVLLVSRQVAL